MKIWKYVIAPLCILIAVLGILEATAVIPPIDTFIGELSPLRICAAIVTFAMFLKYLLSGKVCRTIFFLSLLFMALEPNIAFLCGVKTGNLINNWLLLFYTLLACVGLWLMLPKRKKFKNQPVYYQRNGIGSRTIYIDSTSFTTRYVENNLGSSVIRFENAENYTGGGVLNVENNLGSTAICVPSNWKLDCEIENNLGRVRNFVGNNTNGPVLTVRGENNLGSVVIQRL